MSANETIPPEVRDSLIIEAQRRYPTDGGNVAWAKAFAENPDWREKLAPTTPQLNRLYVRTANMQKRGHFKTKRKQRRALARKPKRTLRRSPVATNGVPQTIAVQLMCPKCGTHLVMPNTHEVAVKMISPLAS